MADDQKLIRAIERLTAAVDQLTTAMTGGQPPPDSPCPRCRGRREWAPGVPCEACSGSGKVGA